MFRVNSDMGQSAWEDSDSSGGEEVCCFYRSRIFVIVLKSVRQFYQGRIKSFGAPRQ